MKKILIWLILGSLLLSGCGSVEKLYALPQRSEAYCNLQQAMEAAMAGLEYAAPLNGSNRQLIQQADLDGDGIDEYLLYARDAVEKNLKILIFSLKGEQFILKQRISCYGAAFDQVEYIHMDGAGGCELAVGVQVSDTVVGRVTVFAF